MRGLHFELIAPRKVKEIITGHGSASKQEIKFLVQEIFKKRFKDYHEADAVAVGMAFYIIQEGREK